MTIVRVENVSKSYHKTPVLNNINLKVEEGEFVAIMGPSGSGKSTLMHLIGGLDQVSSGSVWLKDRQLNTLNDKQLSQLRRRQIGFIFQLYNLIPVLTARDNVAMPLILDGVKRTAALERAAAMLDLVGLARQADQRPSEMSGGQQQRVAIARALVIEPTLILGDEPTGALDTRSGDEVMQLLRQTTQQTRRTVVLVTHDARIAAHTDRIITIRDGEIVDDNRLNNAKNAPKLAV
jgi:putative ABC transport system ATP-binding protein